MENITLPQAGSFDVEIAAKAKENLSFSLEDSAGKRICQVGFTKTTAEIVYGHGERKTMQASEGDDFSVYFEVFTNENTCRVLVWNQNSTGTMFSVWPVSLCLHHVNPAMLQIAGEGVFSAEVLENAVPVGEKTRGILYNEAMVQAAQENAKQFSWAADMRDLLVQQAAYWRNLSYDALWEKMFQAGSATRSLMVWSDGHCPACKATLGLYAWETDPQNHPWKVFCPSCREMFPKNDFWAYHTSGIDPETGIFSREAADDALLFNHAHPDPADPLHKFGVDNGEGFFDGENRWYFVGYYLYRGGWYKDILEGINRLSEAYLATGDVEYARRTAILLDRAADFFPDFEYYSQGLVYEKPTVTGYITYCIDSAYDVLHMATAYDRVFDAVKNDRVLVEFLTKKAKNFPNSPVYRENAKDTFAKVQENIETRIFRHALAHLDRLHTNYPGTDLAAIFIRAVLGWEENKAAIVRRIAMVAKTATHTDGNAGEKGLAGYTAYPVQRLARFLAEFAAVEEGLLPDLFAKCQNLRKTWRFFAETMCLDGFYPSIGDTGELPQQAVGYAGAQFWKPGDEPEGIFRGSPVPSMYTFFWRLFNITNDPIYVQIMHKANENNVKGMPFDLLSQHNAEIETAAANIIAAVGTEFSLGSVNKTEYHLALLRQKNDKSPVCWLAYDAGDYGHAQKNGMQLGMFGFGTDLLTDFGYPPVNKDGWQGPWTAWYRSTFSHNTVVVDGENQQTAAGKTVFFQGEGPVRAVCAEGAAFYAATKRYERTVVQCDLDEGDCYVVDVFRVEGGARHDKFQSAQYATLSTAGLALQPAENPWAADASCALCLANIQADAAPKADWQATFAIANQDEAAPQEIFLRHTELTSGTTAYVFDAWVQQSFNNPQDRFIPRIAASRTGNDGLSSAFVAVIEPFLGQSKVEKIRKLPLTDENGEILPETFVAVELSLVSGEKELVIVNEHRGQIVYQPDWQVKTHSALLVLRRCGEKMVVRGEVKAPDCQNKKEVYP